MFRLTFLTFFGTPRDTHKYEHAHESPAVMTGPLIFLAVLSVVAGWWGIPWIEHGFEHFITGGAGEHHAPSLVLMAVATLVALSGIGLAYQMYYKRAWSPDKVAQRFPQIYALLYNKYYFDELYSVLFIRPFYVLCDVLWTFDMLVIDGLVNLAGWIGLALSVIHNWLDTYLVDGLVNGAGYAMRGLGRSLRFVQTGRLQNYAFLVAFGVLLLAIVQIDLLGLLTRIIAGSK
jgi:NADH-quinone oxidoreductase subunit L